MSKMLKLLRGKILDLSFAKKNLEKVKVECQNRYRANNGCTDITILTPNCVAGEIYNLLGLKFNSPTINCSFEKQKYFVNFCIHLEEYLNVEPKIIDYNGKNPKMELFSENYGSVIINWPHDVDGDIVLENWEKRKKRIIWDKLYIIASTNYLDNDDISRLNSVKTVNTVIFSPKKSNEKNVVFVKKYAKKKKIGKYNVKKLNGLYEFLDFFDFVDFLLK